MSPSERKQRVHEFRAAYNAARKLEELLELCLGWWAVDSGRRQAQRIRLDLAAELVALGEPMADFGA